MFDCRTRIDLVPASNAVGTHFRVVVVVVIGSWIDACVFGTLDYAIELGVPFVQLLQYSSHVVLLLSYALQGSPIVLLGDTRSQRPLLDTLRKNLIDSVRREFHTALVRTVLAARPGLQQTRGTVALARLDEMIVPLVARVSLAFFARLDGSVYVLRWL